MYYVINKNSSLKQPYWWVIKSDGNHATLATSETYVDKAGCIEAIQLVSHEAGDALYYDRTGE